MHFSLTSISNKASFLRPFSEDTTLNAQRNVHNFMLFFFLGSAIKLVQIDHCIDYDLSNHSTRCCYHGYLTFSKNFKFWTLIAERAKNAGLEMRCYRRLSNSSYKDVRRKIQPAAGEDDELLTLLKKRKLMWFGHFSRSSGLAKTVLQGTIKKKKRKRTDRRSDGKTILKSEQE